MFIILALKARYSFTYLLRWVCLCSIGICSLIQPSSPGQCCGPGSVYPTGAPQEEEIKWGWQTETSFQNRLIKSNLIRQLAQIHWPSTSSQTNRYITLQGSWRKNLIHFLHRKLYFVEINLSRQHTICDLLKHLKSFLHKKQQMNFWWYNSEIYICWEIFI